MCTTTNRANESYFTGFIYVDLCRHTSDRNNRQSYSVKFSGNMLILRQQVNSMAWLKNTWPAENCGPY